jgi:hypothetical protein
MIRIYVSHPIRGKVNRDTIKTDEEWSKIMSDNSARAVEYGRILRERHPDVDFYVPGDHEEFVQLAYEQGYLHENTILEIDCEIIDGRDAVILYDWQKELSGGMIREYDHAQDTDKPVQLVNGETEDQLIIIDNFINGLR